MKTNVNMIRPMGQFKVTQRTKDGMFNATELLKQWNKSSGQQKQMIHFTELKATNEFIETLLIDEDSKERNHVLLKTRGKTGGTWMHPYLFIDFAMWLNPKFKLQVIKFVYDQLIEYRHQAGDHHKELMKAAARLKKIDYAQISKGLNYIVFGKHYAGIRQTASQTQLDQLNTIQKNLAFAIDMGLINTYDNLIIKMRQMYHQKYAISA